MAITKFDAANARAIGIAAEEALQEVAKRFGLTVTRQGGTFGEADFTSRFKWVIGDAEAIEQRAHAKFADLAPIFGLKPEDYRRTFKQGSKIFRIDAIETHRKKPIICSDLQGREYLFDREAVRRGLADREMEAGAHA